MNVNQIARGYILADFYYSEVFQFYGIFSHLESDKVRPYTRFKFASIHIKDQNEWARIIKDDTLHRLIKYCS